MSVPSGFIFVIYVLIYYLVKYIFHNRVNECNFVQLGHLCPSSSQVPQATRIGWTAWRAVWGQNGCIPVRKGPQQD